MSSPSAPSAPSSPSAPPPGPRSPRPGRLARLRTAREAARADEAAAFDALYERVRTRLLVQTYALTADLPAARRAVRDAFATGWHRWRKVGAVDDPEAVLRPIAWQHAVRRHTTRLWHRDKHEDPEVRATLQALRALPLEQRRALLLRHLAGVGDEVAAREMGVPPAEAARLLDAAETQLGAADPVPGVPVTVLLARLADRLGSQPWPRPRTVRRQGAQRRHTHAVVGTALAATALTVAGLVVGGSGAVRVGLDEDQVAGPATPRTAPTRVDALLAPDALLTSDDVAPLASARRWSVAGTDGNGEGNGMVLPCQEDRYADPDGTAALVRRFTTPNRGTSGGVLSAVQMTELSASTQRAGRTYATLRSWFGSCAGQRAQLLASYRAADVGDRADVLVLRGYGDGVRTWTVATARTGRLVTTLVRRVDGAGDPEVAATADVLARSVSRLCGTPGGGSCGSGVPPTGSPEPVASTPPPTGDRAGLVAEIDLPPVSGVDAAWVGTRAAVARQNLAATPCDRADFGGARSSLTRTFVIPEADLPTQFGLTETAGRFASSARAADLVAQVRARMGRCEDARPGTEVTALQGGQGVWIWSVTAEVSASSSVRYLMAVVRVGSRVAQVGFVATPDLTLADGAFRALAERAAARLPGLATD